MKYSKQLIICFLVTTLLALGMVACDRSDETRNDATAATAPTLPTTVAVNEVKTTQSSTENYDTLTLFAQNCATCHGPTGNGTTIAPPLNSVELRARLDDDAIRTTITSGRPGTAMPAWGNVLSSDQIDALIDLIRHWPELDEGAMAQLQEEAVETTIGPGMMGYGTMGNDMMNSHMDRQEMVPSVMSYPGQNPAWGHYSMNSSSGSWQGDSCCGWGMMRPGN